MSRRTDIACEIQSIFKLSNDKWLALCQSSTVFAGKFAVMEVHLLFFKNLVHFDNSVGNTGVKHAHLIFTYLTLFFCLGAVVSGNILPYAPEELPVLASQEIDLLRSRGVKRAWVWVMWHWCFSLIAGTASLITQMLLYVWLEEPNTVRITVSIITVFAVLLPLVHLILGIVNTTVSVPIDLRGVLIPTRTAQEERAHSGHQE